MWAIYNPKTNQYAEKNKNGALKTSRSGKVIFTDNAKKIAYFDDINYLFLYHGGLISQNGWLFSQMALMKGKVVKLKSYNAEEALYYMAQESIKAAEASRE